MSFGDVWAASRAQKHSILWTIFLVANGLIYLNLSVGTPICYDDCLGYIGLMGHYPSAFTYLQILTGLSHGVVTYRPWFVPTFFSMFGPYNLATTASIVFFQSFFLYFSWIVFARAVANLFSGLVANIAFIVLSVSVYAQQYYVFNKFIRSDTLAMATALLFLAVVFGFDSCVRRIGGGWTIFLLLITGFIALGTRDANLLIVVAGLVYLGALFRHLLSRKQVWALLLGGLLIVGQQMAQSAKWFAVNNVQHILAGFVLPTPSVAEFFSARGMPYRAAPDVKLPLQPWCSANMDEIGRNADLANIRGAWRVKAIAIWPVWLATHPAYVAAQIWHDRECILGQSFVDSRVLWTDPFVPPVVYIRWGAMSPIVTHGPHRIAPQDYIDTGLKIVISLIGDLLLAYLFWTRRLKFAPASIFLSLVGMADAALAYFADLWEPSEMLRHAFVGAVLFNTGFVVCVLSLVAVAWGELARRIGVNRKHETA